MTELDIDLKAVTPARFGDLEELFGVRGACGGCWCMTSRVPRAVFERQKGDANRRALGVLVDAGPPPGLIAYVDGVPSGWVSVAAKEGFLGLARSPIARRGAAAVGTFVISCLFVAPRARGQGVAHRLVAGAVSHARELGARRVEAYPVVPTKRLPDVFAWWGPLAIYEAAGFHVVARPSASRAVVMREIDDADTGVTRRRGPSSAKRPGRRGTSRSRSPRARGGGSRR